jgi:hypothetical protein
MIKQLRTVLLLITFVLLIAPTAISGDSQDKKKYRYKYCQKTFNKIRIEAFYQFGGALKKITVGSAHDNEGNTKDVTIAGGGGEGGGFVLGYNFPKSYQLDIGVFFKKSRLIPTSITNASGSFKRTVITGTAKYVLSISNLGAFKFGAGAGYYMPGNLDLDFSKVPEGEHIVCSYNNAFGLHLTVEYEHLYKPELFKTLTLAFSLGIKYYNVSYTITTSKVDGVHVTFIESDFNELDGSGIDMYGSLVAYIGK